MGQRVDLNARQNSNNNHRNNHRNSYRPSQTMNSPQEANGKSETNDKVLDKAPKEVKVFQKIKIVMMILPILLPLVIMLLLLGLFVTIFSNDDDGTSGGGVPTETVVPAGTIYRQGDPAWGDIPLGKSSSTMASAGCAVTSIAIGIAFSGTQTTSSTFDAGVFIRALNAGNCFTERGWISWGCSAITKIAPSVHFVAKDENVGTTNKDKIALIKKYPLDKYIVITHYANSSTYSHYVNFQEFIDSNTYMSRDPGVGALVSHSISEIDHIVVYSY